MILHALRRFLSKVDDLVHHLRRCYIRDCMAVAQALGLEPQESTYFLVISGLSDWISEDCLAKVK